MKKFFKFGCLGAIALVVLLIVIGVLAGGGDEDKPQTNDTSKTDGNSGSNSTTEEKPKKEGVLTEEKFNQIKSGMSYEEVKAIIGSEGNVISESGQSGNSDHTVMYEWSTDGVFSNANFMFQGDKLINKAQMGVTNSSTAKVTKEKFDQISNGMTYEEVVEILGGEGDILSESGEKGTPLHTVIYMYEGESGLGSNANFTFQGNKLENKAQFGLE